MPADPTAPDMSLFEILLTSALGLLGTIGAGTWSSHSRRISEAEKKFESENNKIWTEISDMQSASADHREKIARDMATRTDMEALRKSIDNLNATVNSALQAIATSARIRGGAD